MASKSYGFIAWSVLDETFSGLTCFSYHAVFIYHAFSCSASGYHFCDTEIASEKILCIPAHSVPLKYLYIFMLVLNSEYVVHGISHFMLSECIAYLIYSTVIQLLKQRLLTPTHAYTCTNKHTSAAAETLEWPLFLHLSFSMSFSHLCLVLWSFWVLIFSQGASCGNTWCQ